MMLGGRRLPESAIHPPNPNSHVSSDLLRWHLRICILGVYERGIILGVRGSLILDRSRMIRGDDGDGEWGEAGLFSRLEGFLNRGE